MPLNDFTSTEDSVTARLELDVPENMDSSLKNISSTAQDIQTSLEAASKFGESFVDYAEKLPEIQRSVMQFEQEQTNALKERLQLEKQITEQRNLQGGGKGGQESVQTRPDGLVEPQPQGSPGPRKPPEPIAPLTPKMQGLVDYRARLADEIDSPGALFEQMRQRGLTSEALEQGQAKQYVTIDGRKVDADAFAKSPNEQGRALDLLAKQSSPNGDENGGWGRQAAAARRGASAAMGATRAGGNNVGALQGLSEFAGSLGKGGTGAGAGMLLKGAGVAGGAAAALSATQEVGEWYQGLKNQGNMHNEGFAGGLETESDVRMMALSPFVTTEQARQVVMGALKSGYSGESFDTVTDFMAKNLKDMNMQVSDSVQLLTKNVQEGGQSISGLGSQLAQLQTLSGAGPKTSDQLQKDFGQVSGNVISQGGTGQAAGQQAIEASQLFNNSTNGQPNPLSQAGTGIISQAMNSIQIQGMLAARFAPGTPAQLMVAKLSQAGTLNENIMTLLKEQAQKSSAMGPERGPLMFQQTLKGLGIAVDLGVATNLFKQLLDGDPMGDAKKQIDQSTSTTEVADPDSNPNVSSVNGWGVVGAGLSDLWSGLTGGHSRELDKGGDEYDAKKGKFSNKSLDNLVQQYGSENVVVYDPSGKPHKIDYNDAALMKGLGDGSWSLGVAQNDDQKSKLEDNFESGAGSLQKGSLQQWAYQGGPSSGSQGIYGNMQIGLTPEARRLFSAPGSVPMTPHAEQSGQGFNGVTPNNPSPGSTRAGG